MRLAHRRRWAGLALLLLAGCGRHDEPLVAVEGHVFFHGAPLSGGTVVFAPDPERGGDGPLARAEIGPDGHYALSTGDAAGAGAGWYRVTVAAPPLPRRYTDPERSGQRVEVKPGAPNTIDLHLD
jgi:hypothetical protein